MPIMTGTFEHWFKQCDDSILNDTARATSGNIALGKTPRRGVPLRRERQNENRAMTLGKKLGNLGRVDYLSGLTDIAGVRRQ
jgi:hypothetical protein